MPSVLFITTIVCAAAPVWAKVSLINPLDGQFPLIARIGANYTWTMSSKTFSTDLNKSLDYSASGLPAWLQFDTGSLTFSGVPAGATDEGRPTITVFANDTESSASSSFVLCVTPYPGPTVQVPITQQFFVGNSALSSVFLLSPGSALATDEPTLRVPAHWSFSIGLDGNTFVAENDLFYGAILADGTPLPDWLGFDALTLTFDGVAPSYDDVATPLTLGIVVVGADQEGYSAASVMFDLVVASHELSAYATLPTVNVTAGTSFNVTMCAAADFTGVLLDGLALQPANITALAIDVPEAYQGWLEYDAGSRTLYGAPPTNFTADDEGAEDGSGGKPTLPVTLTTTVNQTLYTSVALDVVPSYFTTSDLGVIDADPGQTVEFSLVKYFANRSSDAAANLSASFNPWAASAYLEFNTTTAQLTGQIPKDSDTPKVSVTFVAYSYLTHSTSHATLVLESPALERINGSGSADGGDGFGGASKSEITLIVSLVFGIIGGVFFLGFALALFRRCVRVKDSAVLGEEGTRAWTEDEKRWYGIGIEVRDSKEQGSDHGSGYGYGYGWSNVQADTSAISEKGSLETQAAVAGSYDNTLGGLGLRRVSPHGQQQPTTPSTVQASCAEGVMKKAEFLGRIRDTARNVSDRYTNRRRVSPSGAARPNISYPIPLARRDEPSPMAGGGAPGAVVVPIQGQYVEIVKSTSESPTRAESAAMMNMSSSSLITRDNDHLTLTSTEKRTSTVASFTTSPSNSTGDRSIPRRRADFVPPNSPRGPRAPVPAVVRDVRRSLVRESLQSTSGISADSHPDSLRPALSEERPRLKQFTHASRVPPPRSPSSNVEPDPATSSGAGTRTSVTGAGTVTGVGIGVSTVAGAVVGIGGARRVASQTAQVYKENNRRQSTEGGAGRHTSIDELRIGMHYVRTLGEGGGAASSSLNNTNANANSNGPGPRSVSDKSFSSLESSLRSGGHGGIGQTSTATRVPTRYLARAGEKFRFRVPMGMLQQHRPTKLEARLMSGRALPAFLQAELRGFGHDDAMPTAKKGIEFFGVPTEADVGELHVGVFSVDGHVAPGGECLARVVVEVVGKGSGKKASTLGEA